MKVVIIEDERPASKRIIQFLETWSVDMIVVAVLETVTDCKRWFESNEHPDLILSDIQLLDDNVFALFEKIKIECPVIFMSAYDQYLLQAFKTNGIAYLLKPFEYEAFAAAMNKYNKLKNMYNTQWAKNISALFSSNQKGYKNRFTVKSRDGILLLDISNVALIQITNGVVYAFDHNSKRYPLIETLNEIEKCLDPKHFFRINRSDIISVTAIEKVYKAQNDACYVKLKCFDNGFNCSISKTAEFKKWLDQ